MLNCKEHLSKSPRVQSDKIRLTTRAWNKAMYILAICHNCTIFHSFINIVAATIKAYRIFNHACCNLPEYSIDKTYELQMEVATKLDKISLWFNNPKVNVQVFFAGPVE
ncbi:hypothetical protein M9H77_23930 [Catharanthus roseus]|uniref:Uncharacterized protein n=1 Tax=Catharanthus roseus TaxID=4058 RepID=A0ACC0AX80_CATRO|nr:hypothetical protein M9H77_23930 [Catharanthus roseus]